MVPGSPEYGGSKCAAAVAKAQQRVTFGGCTTVAAPRYSCWYPLRYVTK